MAELIVISGSLRRKAEQNRHFYLLNKRTFQSLRGVTMYVFLKLQAPCCPNRERQTDVRRQGDRRKDGERKIDRQTHQREF